MTWYKPNNPKILVETTPTKPQSEIQVPSSSPIYIQSPPKSGNDDIPSIINKDTIKIDYEREKLLESKRQAIRNHKNFPIIRKRFYYVSESDIFKAFVKGKGDLREVTVYLNRNFSVLDHERKQQQQQREQQQQQMKDNEAQLELQRLKRLEFQKNLQMDSSDTDQDIIASAKPGVGDVKSDDDESPIKLRGRSRSKAIESPLKEPISTKVELTKPKISILDKYGYKKDSRSEPSQPKKKLVRLSSLNSSSDNLPQTSLNSFAADTGPSFNIVNNKIIKSTEEDELEILEAKINNQRKINKNDKSKNSKQVVLDSEDDFSDGISEEYEESNGLTSMDDQILEFLNTAELQDLIEISLMTPNIIKRLIEVRPFKSLDDLSEETFEPNLKKRPRKTNGLRIIENTESSLKGYRAVDSLVKKCSDVGLIISKQMEKWGVDVNGGELEMVEIPEDKLIQDDEDDGVIINSKKGIKYLKGSPDNFSPEFELKNYQLVGVNWLNLLYSHNLSCILADEMGLGKTCQVIAFMAHLKSVNLAKGPHLVVVPLSTLENWLREFSKFCPDLVVQAYYGSQSEREELRYNLRNVKYDVMVTTYNLASGSSNDFKFLVKNNFDMVIYDEGHMLKNSNSDRYNKLMRLDANFRLLLTGTPLQNNLKELVSLLAFMLPNYFVDKKDDLQIIFNQKVKTSDINHDYNPLLAQQAISKAKTMMSPFVLRRKKIQVLKHLPAKHHKVEYCELTPTQQLIYDEYLNKGKQTRQERERRKGLTGKEAQEARKNPIPNTSNVLMLLRKASIHPLLFRTLYTDDKLLTMSKAITKEPEYADANQQYIFEDMQVMADYELNNLCHRFHHSLKSFTLDDEQYLNSGKVTKLIEVIEQVIKRDEKILVFSLFTQVLDILEKIMSMKGFKFVRLDGLTSVENRQDIIDTFYEDNTIPVFLLSTRAGGFGINLIAANNVVIFDQSFNPHDDKQAEDRSHRVGQTKEVKVSKLIVQGTIEQSMLMVAENKLALDQSISEDFEEKAGDLVEKLLFS